MSLDLETFDPFHRLDATVSIPSILSWLSRRFNQHKDTAEIRQADHPTDQPGPYDYPQFSPPSPQEILAHRLEYITKLRARKYRVPEGISADTPLYALYRLYEFFVVDHVTG